MNVRTVVAALAVGVAATTALAGSAQAAPRITEVYSSGTFLPSDFAVSHGNLAFVACATVTQVKTDGSSGPVPYPGCSGHVVDSPGIAYSADGRALAQTLTLFTPSPFKPITSTVEVRSEVSADVRPRVQVSDVEYDHNPDGGYTYGTTSSSSCVRDALGVGASYPGRLDSQLPAVARAADGWYVADRGGNTIYRLDGAGAVSVLAVLPPVKVTVSAALAASNGWPRCVVGTKVAFEAAPTEVEVGPDGSVYAAGLPALASRQLADRSVIYKINPKSGKVTKLSQAYPEQVDLAVGTRGRLFVARPDEGKISVIKQGRSSTYVRLPGVASVETDEQGRLYAVRGARTGAGAHDADVVRIG